MPHAVILMNLGTPAEPTPAAVRKFLRAFLSDTRVVEIPKPLWQIILNVLILPLRPKRIAPGYQQIWNSSADSETVTGSPILYYLRRQAELLQQHFDHSLGKEKLLVRYAMCYSEPQLTVILDELRQQGVESFTIFPLYPQFSATTTGAVYDQVAAIFRSARDIPDISIIRDYWKNASYIRALANSVRDFWRERGAAERLLISFHGIPQANIRKGDPYYRQCCETAEKLAQELELSRSSWEISFQSRFGKAEWLQPYTDKTLMAWGQQGTSSVDVICPAFSADCLETLEEIMVENRAIFMSSGGNEYRYIPALNLRTDHIEALASIIQDKLPLFASSQ
ncbi:MAG: ferrochelatase [Gammaproteobacteria bacterium]|nr:ferrochelatase [Gammaproteobacteria bacterium]